MKYLGQPDYHQKNNIPATGILLSNLGTPSAPSAKMIRAYLGEFLSDPRVIELPKMLWWPILHGIILRLRPRIIAKAYRKIWTESGSPLAVISKQQAEYLQTAVATKWTDRPIIVDLAMRYGEPSISSCLQNMAKKNVQRLLILPLYPQYSATTTATVFDAIAKELNQWRWLPEIRMVNHYHDHPHYIQTLATSIEKHWEQHHRADRLLFSFHGLPQHYFLSGDPYHCACHKTARLVAEQLQLKQSDWQITFQSRFGRRPWLQPYTDVTLKTLAQQDEVNCVDIICPGFAADCLETLEEIMIQNREIFLKNGGQDLRYIPALNVDKKHIELLLELISLHTQGWDEFSTTWDKRSVEEALSVTNQRATDLGTNKRSTS